MNWYYWENGGFKGVFFGKFILRKGSVKYDHKEFFSISAPDRDEGVLVYHATDGGDSFQPTLFRLAEQKEVDEFKFLWIKAQIVGGEVEESDGHPNEQVIELDLITFEKINSL